MIERDTEFKPQFRAELLGTLMTALFVKQHEKIKNEICHIIHMNSCQAFRYKSKSYIDKGLPNYTKKMELKHELRAEMDNILNRQDTIELDYILIDAYLTRAMNVCKTVAHLYQVVPEQLHRYFPSNVKHHYSNNSQRKMEEGVAAKFVSDNTEAHNKLMQRLLTIMILN